MKIELIKVGKPAFAQTPAMVTDYLKRASVWLETQLTITRKQQQDLNLIKSANVNAFWIILDEVGELFTSVELSKLIEQLKDNPSVSEVYFVIGGPYGVPEEYKKVAKKTLSLGKITLPSDLAWLITSEQIYRALSISNGSSYHHS